MILSEVERLRSEPGRAALLFITDRCPVGCLHCSVDSKPNSPKITDRPLFESVIDGLEALDLKL